MREIVFDNLKQNLRKEYLDQDDSMKFISRETGVPYDKVTDIISYRDKKPNELQLYVKLADYFGVTISELNRLPRKNYFKENRYESYRKDNYYRLKEEVYDHVNELKELSKKTDINYNTLSGYLNRNQRIPYTNLLKLSEVLEIEIENLIEGKLQEEDLKRFKSELDDIERIEYKLAELNKKLEGVEQTNSQLRYKILEIKKQINTNPSFLGRLKRWILGN